MYRGWVNAKSKDGIMDFAINDYANQAAEFEIFSYIQEASCPDPKSDVLLKKLSTFIEPDAEQLKTYI